MAVIPSERVQVVVRLDKDVVKRIDHLAVDLESFRGEAMERLLRLVTELIERVKATITDWSVLEHLFKEVMTLITKQPALPLAENSA